jgi:hypothetical protein
MAEKFVYLLVIDGVGVLMPSVAVETFHYSGWVCRGGTEVEVKVHGLLECFVLFRCFGLF